MKRNILLLIFLSIINFAYSQVNGISIGKEGKAPHPKAIVEMGHNIVGILPPRMTTKERNNIFASINLDAIGLLVYDLDQKTLMIWNGANWDRFKYDIKEETLKLEQDSLIYYNCENKRSAINLKEYIQNIIKNEFIYINKVKKFNDLPQKGNSNILYHTINNGKLYKWLNENEHSQGKYIPLGLYENSIDSHNIENGVVDSSLLANDAIINSKLALNAIASNKIANKTIAGNKIADKNITNNKFLDKTITTEKIANNTITTNTIANNSIINDNIADKSITSNKIGIIGTENGQFLVYDDLDGNGPETKLGWMAKTLSFHNAEIIDNLTSLDSTKCLSANQGVVLKQLIEQNKSNIKKNHNHLLNYKIIENINDSITGAASTVSIEDLDPNKVLISNNNGKISVCNINIEDIKYLKGVTNNIEENLNTTDKDLDNLFTVGDIKPSIRETDHNGWLICDGSYLAPEQYQSIENVGLATVWNKMGGSSTQRPDLRNKTLTMPNTEELGTSIGNDSILLETNNLPNHNHHDEVENYSKTITTEEHLSMHSHYYKISGKYTHQSYPTSNSFVKYIAGLTKNANIKLIGIENDYTNGKYILTTTRSNSVEIVESAHSHKLSFKKPTDTPNSDHKHLINIKHNHSIINGDFKNEQSQTKINITQPTVNINYFIFIGL